MVLKHRPPLPFQICTSVSVNVLCSIWNRVANINIQVQKPKTRGTVKMVGNKHENCPCLVYEVGFQVETRAWGAYMPP